ncbi:uncharacterized protein LOC129795826 [Lutzomyia longipalpis]|uniref:uncharacterized protein LOC129795826 n=1 Tax=Lutzomyia longipalpis TaxID=7200 RepID=UPI0024839967|nr:uncharacterized protein LOC129795826 [Lutzomyia longipalpis]
MSARKMRKPRERPVRKWTVEEEKRILDYLIANQPIEVPTARVYYAQLVEDLKMNLDPNLLRYKVQNMRRVFFKTMDWVKKSRKNGWDDNKIKEYLQKTCRHFKKMRVIFSSFYQKSKFADQDVSDSHAQEDTTPEEVVAMPPTPQTPQSLRHQQTPQKTEEVEEPDLSWISQPTSPNDSGNLTNVSQDPLMDLDSSVASAKSTPHDTMELKKENINLEYFRLEVEKEKLAIMREKLAMERQKCADESNYKILQLEQQERIKIHQIDREAEVKRYELALKYKDEVKTEM